MEYEEIKKLMEDMGNSKLSSLDIEFPDGVKISMTKYNENSMSVVTAERVLPTTVEIPEVPVVQKQQHQTALTETKDNSQELIESLKTITSPMVGTFYASSSPDKPPYVKKGDKVNKGQVVCIVEAMKLMNEIESEFEGEIVEICVNNGDIVEYGMPLFKLK